LRFIADFILANFISSNSPDKKISLLEKGTVRPKNFYLRRAARELYQKNKN